LEGLTFAPVLLAEVERLLLAASKTMHGKVPLEKLSRRFA
jgi:hypothetical protein